MDRVKILGTGITDTNLNSALDYIQEHFSDARGTYICVANVHTTVTARENPEYQQIQNNSFMTLPDGKPLSIIGRRRGYHDMDRVTGPEFMEGILKLSEETHWHHYFYGNTKENLDILIAYLKKQYPDLIISGYEPSVFHELSVAEEEELIARINQVKPDFVWVGIGAPRQEVLCAKVASDTKSIWVGVGGAFNVIAGIIPRAPVWMQKMCLEWFYRWMQEPRRLFKRYFVTNTKFIHYLIHEKKLEK